MSRSTFKVLFYVNGSKEKERNRPHHGTGDNQRDCITVQLQAEHSKDTLGREREQGERQGTGSEGH